MGEHSSRGDSIGYRLISFDHKFRLVSLPVLASDHAFRRLASYRKLIPGKHLENVCRIFFTYRGESLHHPHLNTKLT